MNTDPNHRIPVRSGMLAQLLHALNGPGHWIRELQATRDVCELTKQENPINELTKDYEAGMAAEAPFDFAAHLARQAAWSEQTFGPGSRLGGIIDHIRKELIELADSEGALAEWVDVVILALDGCWRSGASPAEIIAAIVAKQARNESRNWPDWRTMPTDKAIEHDRSGNDRNGLGLLFRDDRLPAPGEDGMFSHPDLDMFCSDGHGNLKNPEDEAIIDKALMASAGWEMYAVVMDSDDPDHEHYDFSGYLDHWNPEPPNATWKLVAKHDSEDGAQAIFVRRIGTPDPIAPEQSALPL